MEMELIPVQENIPWNIRSKKGFSWLLSKTFFFRCFFRQKSSILKINEGSLFSSCWFSISFVSCVFHKFLTDKNWRNKSRSMTKWREIYNIESKRIFLLNLAEKFRHLSFECKRDLPSHNVIHSGGIVYCKLLIPRQRNTKYILFRDQRNRRNYKGEKSNSPSLLKGF